MTDEQPSREQTHRTGIPGLAGDADFCTECNDYCGGAYDQCVCCGGEGTGARAQKDAAERAAEASGAPVPGGTQVSPQTGPGRVAQYPSAAQGADGRPADQQPG